MTSRHTSSNVSTLSLSTCLFLSLGILIHLFLGLGAIERQSPTYDEPRHLTAGYASLKSRDYSINSATNPALPEIIAAAPLLIQNHSLRIDDPQFLFFKRKGPEIDATLRPGRLATLVISCIFLLGMYFIGRSLFGPVAGWAAFLVAVFFPAFLAYSTIVTPDYLFAVFYFLFFVFLGFWEKESAQGSYTMRWPMLSGICLAGALCSSYSAWVIVPVVALWVIIRRGRLFILREMFVFAAAALLTVVVVYQAVGLPVFFNGLWQWIHAIERRPFIFLGIRLQGGWWVYPLLTFLIKTPIPILLGLFIGMIYWKRKALRLPWFILWPPLILFVAVCLSPRQGGYRDILGIYPFLFLAFGLAARELWKYRLGRLAVFFLAVWSIVGTLSVRPFFLGYFNELIDNPSQGYYYVTDSNTDWGQGLKELRRYLDEEGVSQIYLSYYGAVDPAAYGLVYTAVHPSTPVPFEDKDVDLRKEPRSLLAISVTNFQSSFTNGTKDVFGWLRYKKPKVLLAESILVFDITGDAESHLRLADFMQQQGREKTAAIEADWVSRCDIIWYAPLYRRYVEKHPTALGYARLAFNYYIMGWLNESIWVNKKALELRPDWAQAYFNIGYNYALLGQLDDAIMSFRRALELKPDYAIARKKLEWSQSIKAMSEGSD